MSGNSPKQFAENREKTRNTILDVALELFATRGFSGTSISLIAEKAGISKGLIYHYFKNKQALLKAILETGLSTIEETIERVFQIQDPSQKIVVLIERSFSLTERDERFWRLYTNLLLQPGIWEEFKKESAAFLVKAIQQFEQLFSELGVPSPSVEARILAAILDGVSLHFMIDKKNYPLTEIKNALIQRYRFQSTKEG